VDLVEIDEVVGYHLEQAHRYVTGLGRADDTTRELAGRAADRLAAAGRRAELRGDIRAATSLLARAVDLYPKTDRRRLNLLPTLGRALFDAGEWDRADQMLAEAIEAGKETGDRRLVADASVSRMEVQLHRESDISHQEIRMVLDEAVRVFTEVGDQAALARALGFAGKLRFWSGDTSGAMDDLEKAVAYARAAGDHVEQEQSLTVILYAIQNGPTPAADGLVRCEQLRQGGNRRREAAILRCESRLEGIQGNFEQARKLNSEAADLAQELGLKMTLAGIQFEAAENELLAGNPVAAEQIIRPVTESLLQIGDYGHYATFGPLLADTLVLLGRDEEATAIIDLVEERAIEDDLDAQIAWRRVRARLLARQQHYAEAEQIAREGIRRADGTDLVDLQAQAYEALADVLAPAGRHHDALGAIERANDLYERKGNVAAATNAQARLTQLRKVADLDPTHPT
jgi:tetratricopeptide (TPR) repeat protein